MSNKSQYYVVSSYKNFYKARVLEPKDIQSLVITYLKKFPPEEIMQHLSRKIFDFKSGGKKPVQKIRENLYIVFAFNQKYAITLAKKYEKNNHE